MGQTNLDYSFTHAKTFPSGKTHVGREYQSTMERAERARADFQSRGHECGEIEHRPGEASGGLSPFDEVSSTPMHTNPATEGTAKMDQPVAWVDGKQLDIVREDGRTAPNVTLWAKGYADEHVPLYTRAPSTGVAEAVKPFVEAAQNIDDTTDDRDHMWESAAAMSLTAGDFRRLVAALCPR